MSPKQARILALSVGVMLGLLLAPFVIVMVWEIGDGNVSW